ncbi:MAG TPA: hypothetical protein VGY98_18240 [Verrucomicrobiae bacterium]|nr:hypothetical protein [Verrucomicrobiae bacterium]
MNEPETPYQIMSLEGHFQVVDTSGRVMLDCSNRAGAEQYAAMLNQVYQQGFKAGFRAAKRG